MKFKLNQRVKIKISGEKGHVVGRAEYICSTSMYLIRYKAADGRAAQSWWEEISLAAV